MKVRNKTGVPTLAAWVFASLASPTVLAAAIQGTVTEPSGKPVEGARVYVEGAAQEVYTDAQGRYEIRDYDEEHLHLHVYSPNHVHGDRVFDRVPENLTVDFVLRPTLVENVVVTANALTTSVLESTSPVSVLGGDELRRQQSATLGETLMREPGVHASAFGPVASSPIIRGNDGPRVKIVQNGLDVSDVSRVGPDHNVATETSGAEQIEVLRGPATLQFGSGAIGGVVNVVDQRIPTEMPDQVEGEAELRFDTVSDEEFARADVMVGAGPMAFQVGGFSREAEDFDIPDFAEIDPEEGEESGTLENSAIDASGFTVGASWIGGAGHFGFAYENLENLYGVPGHAHGHEGEEEEEEEVVQLDVELDRYQASAELLSPFAGVNAIQWRGAYSDYEHVELENGEQGTLFANESFENRVSLKHEAIGGWHGVIGLHQFHSDYEAIGEEAFTPPNETDSLALYVVEEKRIGDFTAELGARVERTEYTVNAPVSIELGHSEEPGAEPEVFTFDLDDRDFTSLSLSAGTIWHYREGYSLALSLTHSERAPSQQELFSAGQHIATRTYDLGLVFALDADEEVSLNRDIEEEVATNLDISWRKFEGNFGFAFSVFYNPVENYIFQANTGLVVEEEHEEPEPGDPDAHEEEGLPVLAFRQEDAELYGFEAEMHYQFTPIFSANLYGDWVRAELDNGENLPRIPPLRLGGGLAFDQGDWFGDLNVSWYDDQDDIAPFETETEGYTLVDASLNYRLKIGASEWTFFLIGRNLGDEEARPHTSFLKDLAPLPGRGVAMGTRLRF